MKMFTNYMTQKNVMRGCAALLFSTTAYMLVTQHIRTNMPALQNSYGQEIFNEYSKKNVAVSEFYAERFAQKEAEIWATLADKNISKEDVIKQQQAFRNNYKKNLPKDGSKSIPRETVTMIHNVAKDFGFKPQDITIVEMDMGSCPAASDDFVLYINLHWLGTYSQPIQEFIIAHELCHMINQDPSLQTILEKSIDRSDPYWKVLSRFCEARADITASTRDPKYAAAGVEYAKALYKKYGNQNNATHPNNTDRRIAHETVHALLQHNPTTPSYA